MSDLHEIAEQIAYRGDWWYRGDPDVGELAEAIEAALVRVQAEATAAERAKHANPHDPDWRCACGTWNNPTRYACRVCKQVSPVEAIEQPATPAKDGQP